jgi:hypothetical protein
MNYYEILEINTNASEQAVMLSFKALFHQYNSDEAQNKEKLEEINQAYLVLSDPAKRAKYDKNGYVWEEEQVIKMKETPKSKWKNYWFYYKWHTYASIFIIIVLAVSIRSCVTKINPDISVMFISSVSLEEADTKLIENELAKYVEDYTKNGKNEVSVNNIYFSKNAGEEQISMAMRQKFIAELAAGDTVLYITDKASIEEFTKNNVLGKINDIEGAITEYDSTLIKLDIQKLFPNLSDYAPKELYIGVRNYDPKTISKAASIKIQKAKSLIAKLIQSS